eukprot:698515-Pleurochrysis_carterae.AAC.1
MFHVLVTPASCSCVERVVISAAPAVHRALRPACLSYGHLAVCDDCEVKPRKCQTGAAGLLFLVSPFMLSERCQARTDESALSAEACAVSVQTTVSGRKDSMRWQRR